MAIVYYISGHGFGHAVRSANVIAHLSKLPNCPPIVARTTAPASLLDGVPTCRISEPRTDLDAGAVELDVLTIDGPGTTKRLECLVADQSQVINHEVDWLKCQNPSVVVADIPWLAGEIAKKTGVPCIGVSNFLWNWIYEPFLTDHKNGASLLKTIVDGYNKFDLILRLPFSHTMQVDTKVRDVPLVADCGNRDSQQLAVRTGFTEADSRPRVVVSLRNGVSTESLHSAVARLPEFVFVVIGECESSLPNLRFVKIDKSLSVADLAAWADIMVAKPGYGIMSTCAANRTRLLYLERRGFEEDRILLSEGKLLFPTQNISYDDFQQGNWGRDLAALISTPMNVPVGDAVRRVRGNGGQVCADIIAKFL